MADSSNIEALRATLARTIASLPEVLRSCSVETLVNSVAPIFADDDYTRCVGFESFWGGSNRTNGQKQTKNSEPPRASLLHLTLS
jgi:hypothetical protein